MKLGKNMALIGLGVGATLAYQKYSVNAVEDVIKYGLANGYTFLPLDITSPTAHHGINN